MKLGELMNITKHISNDTEIFFVNSKGSYYELGVIKIEHDLSQDMISLVITLDAEKP